MYRPRSLTVRVGLLRFPFTPSVGHRVLLSSSWHRGSAGGACINNFTFFRCKLRNGCGTAWVGCPPPGTAGHTKVHCSREGFVFQLYLFLKHRCKGDYKGCIAFPLHSSISFFLGNILTLGFAQMLRQTGGKKYTFSDFLKTPFSKKAVAGLLSTEQKIFTYHHTLKSSFFAASIFAPLSVLEFFFFFFFVSSFVLFFLYLAFPRFQCHDKYWSPSHTPCPIPLFPQQYYFI